MDDLAQSFKHNARCGENEGESMYINLNVHVATTNKNKNTKKKKIKDKSVKFLFDTHTPIDQQVECDETLCVHCPVNSMDGSVRSVLSLEE